jgi:hypothetical protein
MSAIKPVIRELRQAGVKGAGYAKDKLHQVTDNINDHFDTVIKGVVDEDNFDGAPGSPRKPDTRIPGDGGTNMPDGDTRRRGVDRGDGRDDYGHFVGSENRPWIDREQQGLDAVAERRGVDVHRNQVRATIEGHRADGASADQARYYDGLYENADGTYTGIEVKSGSATRDSAQLGFDNAVSRDNPATATLNGNKITIVEVILETVK